MTKKLSLGALPTPIERLDTLSRETGRNLYIKRDDYSGSEVQGNKIRKLEYLLYDALNQDSTAVITTGAVQSNHARATAAACASLGLECHLVLKGSRGEFEGNLFLAQALGAHVYIVDETQQAATVAQIQQKLETQGERVYVVPMGGSNALGSLGYRDAFQEILDYEAAHGVVFDSVTVTTGSGGTYSGLYYENDKQQNGKIIQGISVSLASTEFEEIIRGILIGMDAELDTSRILIKDAYVGEGYGNYTSGEIKQYLSIAKKTGILFDPCYTGKGFSGFLSELDKEPLKDKQNHLFIHTGGIMGWTQEMRLMAQRIINEEGH